MIYDRDYERNQAGGKVVSIIGHVPLPDGDVVHQVRPPKQTGLDWPPPRDPPPPVTHLDHHRSAQARRIAALETTTAEIRAWAFEHRVPCSTNGAVSAAVIDAWERANTPKETA